MWGELISGFSPFANRPSGEVGRVGSHFSWLDFHRPLFVRNLFKGPARLEDAEKNPLLAQIYHKGKKSISEFVIYVNVLH